MRELFVDHVFLPDSQRMIAKINLILEDYGRQGYRLSLRQLYYQLVARAMIPNIMQSYKRLGDLVSNGRLAGLIDWEMIEDRGRETITPPMWEDPAQIVDAAAQQFAIDRWVDQRNHVEVIVEKAALEGILIPVCKELGIRFTANRGYCSQSIMYEIGKRLGDQPGFKRIHILYLGDHDPSGIDMTRDVTDRLTMFSRDDITVTRLALNADQVEQWNPPENPAKTTDSRYRAYMEKFGTSSWELDAIEPATLADLVRLAVVRLRDNDLYAQALNKEGRMKRELESFVQEYRERAD